MPHIYITSEYQGFEELIKGLQKLQENGLARAVDKVTSSVAAGGRSYIKDIEGKGLKLGNSNWKYIKGKGRHNGGSRWNEGGKYYQALSDGRRLENFSFETSAMAKKSIKRKFSQVKVTSNLQNLWAKNTKAYSTNSPWFGRKGDGGYTSRWLVGKPRPAKLNFADFEGAIMKGLPRGLQDGEKVLEEEMVKEGLK